MLPIILLWLDTQARAPQRGPTCEVQPTAIVGRSSSGIPQVSNLALIWMVARIPARPFPAIGQVRYGLDVDVSVYDLGANRARKAVTATVNRSGSGLQRGMEEAHFTIDIPIDSAERDTAIREYISDVMRQAASSPNEAERAAALHLQDAAKNPQYFVSLFRQHRAGLFEIECRVLDEGRVLGVGRATLEVLFKGRFFDQEAFRKK
jgi:hypothetical protein